jgi:hypothetical protein
MRRPQAVGIGGQSARLAMACGQADKHPSCSKQWARCWPDEETACGNYEASYARARSRTVCTAQLCALARVRRQVATCAQPRRLPSTCPEATINGRRSLREACPSRRGSGSAARRAVR